MTPKLLKASDVCALTQLQPYMLRSWEKEFPGIGVQKTPDAARLYRQSDVDQVLRIKQLIIEEGLTLSGARRRLEESDPPAAADVDSDVADVLDALASDARTKIASVRDGLRSILRLLDGASGTRTLVVVDDFRLDPPVRAAAPPQRAKASSRPAAPTVVSAKPAKPATPAPAVSRAKASAAGGRGAQKRSRA